MTVRKICIFWLKRITVLFQGMIQVLSWGRLPGCPMDPIPHKAPFGWLSKCRRWDFREQGTGTGLWIISVFVFGIPLNIFKLQSLQSPSSLSKLLAFYALSKKNLGNAGCLRSFFPSTLLWTKNIPPAEWVFGRLSQRLHLWQCDQCF